MPVSHLALSRTVSVHSYHLSQVINQVASLHSEWLARWLCISLFLHLSPMDHRFVVISLFCTQRHDTNCINYSAGADSAVHISEEALNAAVVVPWSIVSCNHFDRKNRA